MLAGTPAPSVAKGKAAEQAANIVGGVSTRTVEGAITRKRTDSLAHEKAKAGKLPRKKAVDGDRPAKYENRPGYVMSPGKGTPDPVVALRTLELALPRRKQIDAWLARVPSPQRFDVIRLCRSLGDQLHALANDAFEAWTRGGALPAPGRSRREIPS